MLSVLFPCLVLFCPQDQALSGPIDETMSHPPQFEDNSRRIHREAWKALGDMPKEEAKRQFMDRLSSHFPHWPQWYAAHGQEHAAQFGESQAQAQGQLQSQPHRKSQADSHQDQPQAGSQSPALQTQGWVPGDGGPEQLGGVVQGRNRSDSLSDRLLEEFQKKTGLILGQQSRL